MLFAFRSHLNLEVRWNYFYYTRRILIRNLIFSCELDEYLCFSAENFLLMQFLKYWAIPMRLRWLFCHTSFAKNFSLASWRFRNRRIAPKSLRVLCATSEKRIQFEFNKHEKSNHEKILLFSARSNIPRDFATKLNGKFCYQEYCNWVLSILCTSASMERRKIILLHRQIYETKALGVYLCSGQLCLTIQSHIA